VDPRHVPHANGFRHPAATWPEPGTIAGVGPGCQRRRARRGTADRGWGPLGTVESAHWSGVGVAQGAGLEKRLPDAGDPLPTGPARVRAHRSRQLHALAPRAARWAAAGPDNPIFWYTLSNGRPQRAVRQDRQARDWPPKAVELLHAGEVAEWLKAPVLKTGVGNRLTTIHHAT